MVEHYLAKVGVASSNLVSRSTEPAARQGTGMNHEGHATDLSVLVLSLILAVLLATFALWLMRSAVRH